MIEYKREKLPFVSVIVITKNNIETIEDCVASLVNQTYPKDRYEIIFVDGHSSDGTDDVIKRYMRVFPSIKLLYENYGKMGHARNLGVLESKGDIIAFLDGDAVAPENWIECIIARFSEKEVVAVGGFDILVSGSESSKVLDSWRRLKKATGVRAIPHIKTVNFAIRRDALISCGGFDPTLSHFDEGELLARLYAKTKTDGIVYDPEIIVYHKRASSNSVTRRMKRVFEKSSISVPVLMKKYMIKVALANPLSPIATSYYILLAPFLGAIIFLFSLICNFLVEFFIATILIYISLFALYLITMILKSRRFVMHATFVLMADIVVRMAGTLVGLAKWFRMRLNIKMYGEVRTNDN